MSPGLGHNCGAGGKRRGGGVEQEGGGLQWAMITWRQIVAHTFGLKLGTYLAALDDGNWMMDGRMAVPALRKAEGRRCEGPSDSATSGSGCNLYCERYHRECNRDI